MEQELCEQGGLMKKVALALFVVLLLLPETSFAGTVVTILIDVTAV